MRVHERFIANTLKQSHPIPGDSPERMRQWLVVVRQFMAELRRARPKFKAEEFAKFLGLNRDEY